MSVTYEVNLDRYSLEELVELYMRRVVTLDELMSSRAVAELGHERAEMMLRALEDQVTRDNCARDRRDDRT